MNTFEPTGYFLLAKELPQENYTTGGGIELVGQTFTTAEVIEPTAHTEFKEVFKKGDKVLLPENAGMPIQYNGSAHVWLNAKPYPEGHIICRIIDDKKTSKKK